MIKVLTIIGTRPEAIEMAPVVEELQQHPDTIKAVVCTTAQHREMFDQALSGFGIGLDYDLNLMRPNQRLAGITARILDAVDEVLLKESPDWVLVQGDTTTAMTASLAAFYHGTKIGHVEAGLRTGNRREPFPEEVNRRITDLLADLYFAPTSSNAENLLREGVNADDIIITGNTGIDALLMMAQLVEQRSLEFPFGRLNGKRTILVTAHRRENFGEPLERICQALIELSTRYEHDLQIVFPVHMNPRVSEPVHRLLGDRANILLCEPVDYATMVALMKRSTLILTDSGGVQEEAPSLDKPVLVMREVTERTEAVTMGTAKLVGTDYAAIVNETVHLLEDQAAYQKMASVANPYGDGTASKRIVQSIIERS
jgi:UDP-N-acetylglucosamine 2-epimerase (non-hydrolysing)